MHDTLVLPQGPIPGAAIVASMSPPGGEAGLRLWLATALDEAAGRVESADACDAALARQAAAVAGDGDGDEAVDAAVSRMAALARPGSGGARDEVGSADFLARVWAAAGAAVAEARLPEAVVLLLGLALSPAGRADGLLGLSVCAARLERYLDARVLALASRDAGGGHPRSLCVAGLCALKEGDRRAAQSYLAMAARMSRRQPEFREDLRLAQRQLLLMHIS